MNNLISCLFSRLSSTMWSVQRKKKTEQEGPATRERAREGPYSSTPSHDKSPARR